LILDVTGEFAMSNDKVYYPDSALAYEKNADGSPVLVDENGDEIEDPATFTGVPMIAYKRNDDDELYVDSAGFHNEKETGIALLVNANLGYKTDLWGARLAVDFIMNDSAWFNNLAQSPRFFAQRVQNSDKDGQTVKYGVNSPLYSSFDALYNFTPKFSPVATTLNTNDDAFKGSEVNSYNIANYNKNSWTTNVYTRNQLALMEYLLDPALQMALPYGLATANRVGARVNLVANFKEFVEVQGLFSMFNQVKGQSFTHYNVVNDVAVPEVLTYKAAQYTEFGGGAKIDIFKMLGFSKPLEISGSYKHSERTMDTDGWAALGKADKKTSLKSDFINAGLYVQYLPRLGFNAGFQMINTEYENIDNNPYSAIAPLMKGEQMQWMVGLDYNIAPDAWLAINFGMINVSNEYNTMNLVQQGSSDGAVNIPDYYDVTKDVSGVFKSEFSQMVLEASINVEF